MKTKLINRISDFMNGNLLEQISFGQEKKYTSKNIQFKRETFYRLSNFYINVIYLIINSISNKTSLIDGFYLCGRKAKVIN